MEQAERIKKEKEREDKAFDIFESYVRAIIRTTPDECCDDPSEDLVHFRERFRAFIKLGA